MTTRDRLHQLVGELPESEHPEAERILTALRIDDPVLRALDTAPFDDVPETDEERAAVAEAREAIARGDVVPDEELDREPGLRLGVIERSLHYCHPELARDLLVRAHE